jgi:uncharacterized Zn finger protein
LWERFKDEYPEEAIGIYKALVQERIERKKRSAYQEGAGYAKKIKEIYELVLHDPKGWQEYVGNIRLSYKHLPALQDEFKRV